MKLELSDFSDVLVTRIAEATDLPSAKIVDRIIITFYAWQELLKDYLGEYSEAPEFKRLEPDDPEGWKVFEYVKDYYGQLFDVLWRRRMDEVGRKEWECKPKVHRAQNSG